MGVCGQVCLLPPFLGTGAYLQAGRITGREKNFFGGGNFSLQMEFFFGKGERIFADTKHSYILGRRGHHLASLLCALDDLVWALFTH